MTMSPSNLVIPSAEFRRQVKLVVVVFGVCLSVWACGSCLLSSTSEIGSFFAGASLCAVYWLALLVGCRRLLEAHGKPEGVAIGAGVFILKTAVLFALIGLGLEWFKETRVIFLSGFGLMTIFFLAAFWILYIRRDSDFC